MVIAYGDANIQTEVSIWHVCRSVRPSSYKTKTSFHQMQLQEKLGVSAWLIGAEYIIFVLKTWLVLLRVEKTNTLNVSP